MPNQIPTHPCNVFYHGVPDYQQLAKMEILAGDPAWKRIVYGIKPNGNIDIAGCKVADGKAGRSYVQSLGLGRVSVTGSSHYQIYPPLIPRFSSLPNR